MKWQRVEGGRISAGFVKKKPRPFDYVMCDDSSRLGRNLPDVLKISDIFKYDGVELYFVSQRLDSSNPTFRPMHTLAGMMDESFLSGLADKVRRGQKGRILNGFHPGGRCYGYRSVPIEDPSRRGKYGRPAVTGVRLEIDEEEAAVVRRMYDLYASGYSTSDIAKKLNSEGIPPPEHRPRPRSPAAWLPNGIREILLNERYIAAES